MEDYQVKKLDEFRERKVLSFFPFIIAEDGNIIWTSKWFKYVTLKEQKVKERYYELDEFSCNYMWSDWE